MSEAGKLGAIASKEIIAKLKDERIIAYNKNPKGCLFCKKTIPYEFRSNKFCNQSCSAKHNNSIRGIKTYDRLPFCLVCGNKTKKGGRKFCSHNCQHKYRWEVTKKEIEQNQKAGPFTAKRYLIETNGHKCAIPDCGISQWLGKPVLLICDHMNGNSDDWSLTNLRMICSNCDAQTPFYKARNKGNGRHFRRQRYKEGKSF